jgi:hypothetical protein
MDEAHEGFPGELIQDQASFVAQVAELHLAPNLDIGFLGLKWMNEGNLDGVSGFKRDSAGIRQESRPS